MKVYGTVLNHAHDELLGLEEYCWDMARSKIDETVWRAIGGASRQDRFAEKAETGIRLGLRGGMSAKSKSGQRRETRDRRF